MNKKTQCEPEWIGCAEHTPPVGAKIEVMDRDGQTEKATVRKDSAGLYADPGYPCKTRYLDKDDHLPRWRWLP